MKHWTFCLRFCQSPERHTWVWCSIISPDAYIINDPLRWLTAVRTDICPPNAFSCVHPTLSIQINQFESAERVSFLPTLTNRFFDWTIDPEKTKLRANFCGLLNYPPWILWCFYFVFVSSVFCFYAVIIFICFLRSLLFHEWGRQHAAKIHEIPSR